MGQLSSVDTIYAHTREFATYLAKRKMETLLADGNDLIEYHVYFNGLDWCASQTRPTLGDYVRVYVQNHGDGNEVHDEIVRRIR